VIGPPARSVSVIGATGFVGGRIYRRLRESARGRLAVSGTGFRRAGRDGTTGLDVTDPRALSAYLRIGFDVVVVAAGTKDVGCCEREPARAIALNAAPVERMVRTIRDDGLPTRLVYLSTDYVFDGERGRYRDDDTPAPRTAYGRSKALGERAVLQAGRGHQVVRTGAVMGRGAPFFDWLLEGLREGRELRLFHDCWFSPTPAVLLADAIVDLLLALDAVPGRILHAAGDVRMSRLELGRLIEAMVPRGGAVLVPEACPREGSTFQRDLSLVPSEWLRLAQRPSVEEYLRRELGEAPGAGEPR
jgi:dTDP-4-dehydrorhamnose reductase